MKSESHLWTAVWVDPKTGRPIENSEARYETSRRSFAMRPSFLGAHSWHPMAWSPKTGLVYIPTEIFDFDIKPTKDGPQPAGRGSAAKTS